MANTRPLGGIQRKQGIRPGEINMGLEHRIWQFQENPHLRFSKVAFRSKRPFEKNWVRKPYTYEQIQKHIREGTNYGLLCGYGGLAVPDADRPELEEAIASCLPQTFTVRTGGGGAHFYYICPEIHRRIVLEKDGTHYGEVQSFGQQVVGPGSIHPNGCSYMIENDCAIQAISFDQMITAIKPFMKRPRPKTQIHAPMVGINLYSGINSIPITTVIDISHFKRAANGELYGPSPWHGSETGMNTWINEQKNVAYCFRHNCGISVVKAMALNEGFFTECDGRLSRAQYTQVMMIAKNKYGT